jgi:hypothetical protein
MYTVYLQTFTSQYFFSNYLHGSASTEIMHAETLSNPRTTYQFNSAHFPSVVRHLSTHHKTTGSYNARAATKIRVNYVCVVYFNGAVTTGRLASVGNSLQSTPTNGRRFTALGLPWRSPVQIII